MKIELVAFDVAGTVLNDDGLVIKAFKNALESSQPELWPTHGKQWTQYAIDTMGQSKVHVFTELLGDTKKAIVANTAFEAAYLTEMTENGPTPIEGAEDLFRYLKNKGIAVALTTGFSRSTLDVIINKLGWSKLIDLSVVPDEAGRGRPHPDMLNMAVRILGITTLGNTIVCGDTAADMQAGIAFGAGQVIGVLTGSHDEQVLWNSGATSVVNSVAELKSLI